MKLPQTWYDFFAVNAMTILSNTKYCKIAIVWSAVPVIICFSKEKKEEIWLSPMTKAPTPEEMSKGQSDNTNNATKKFDYTAVADRLRTVSWSNYGKKDKMSIFWTFSMCFGDCFGQFWWTHTYQRQFLDVIQSGFAVRKSPVLMWSKLNLPPAELFFFCLPEFGRSPANFACTKRLIFR